MTEKHEPKYPFPIRVVLAIIGALLVNSFNDGHISLSIINMLLIFNALSIETRGAHSSE